MLTPYDHTLAVLLVAMFPVWGSTLGYRRLKRADPDDQPRLRLVQYRRAIAVQWLLAGALLALWVTQRRAWSPAPAGLGVTPLLTWGLGGVVLGTLIVLVYLLRVRAQIMGDDEGLAEVRRELQNVEPLMPHTPREFRGFVALSLTAGLCEELLYRGFLIWYFAHFMGVIPAAAVATVAFGVGHSYQGIRGALKALAAGGFLSAVYLLSGSLFMPMLLHALMDLHSGHLAYVAYAREDAEREAERLRQAQWEAEVAAEDTRTADAPPHDEGNDAASL